MTGSLQQYTTRAADLKQQKEELKP